MIRRFMRCDFPYTERTSSARRAVLPGSGFARSRALGTARSPGATHNYSHWIGKTFVFAHDRISHDRAEHEVLHEHEVARHVRTYRIGWQNSIFTDPPRPGQLNILLDRDMTVIDVQYF